MFVEVYIYGSKARRVGDGCLALYDLGISDKQNDAAERVSRGNTRHRYWAVGAVKRAQSGL